jgi:cytochrome c biogenesis protein CcmG/thiol:disulfide interchange protein DsbE
VKRSLLLWLPLALMGLLFVGFYAGLENPTDHVITSKVVGKELPDFDAPPILPGFAGTSSTQLRDGKPRLVNVFASWCVPCVEEVPVLAQLKAQGVEIAGIAVHDRPEDLQAFLTRNGNPYATIGSDGNGQVQIALGSSGVPETFLIDAKGQIVLQHIGVVTEADVLDILAKLGTPQ